jgi:hypothetical protein
MFLDPPTTLSGVGKNTGGLTMVGRSLFVTALALVSLGAPRAVQAQAATPAAAAAAPQAIDAKLVEFAKLHATMNTARDEFFAKIGRTHDDEGKAALREEFNKHITEVLTKAGTTQADYQRMIFVISSDPAQREQFEKALKQVTESAAL